MESLQMQARALGDPTRYEIFRYVVATDVPVGVAQLTEHLGLNHNAIRQHLAKLVEAGLLNETVAPVTGRGRPRLNYVVDPSCDGRWGVVGPYERLAVLLTEMVKTGESPVEVGRRAARQRLTTQPDGQAVGALVDQMARLGFEPSLRERAGSVEVTLQVCPFTEAVLADPDTV